MKTRVCSVILMTLLLTATTAFSTNGPTGGCTWWECLRSADTAMCRNMATGEPEPGQNWRRASACTDDYRQCMFVFDPANPGGGGYLCYYDCNIADDCYSV